MRVLIANGTCEGPSSWVSCDDFGFGPNGKIEGKVGLVDSTFVVLEGPVNWATLVTRILVVVFTMVGSFVAFYVVNYWVCVSFQGREEKVVLGFHQKRRR